MGVGWLWGASCRIIAGAGPWVPRSLPSARGPHGTDISKRPLVAAGSEHSSWAPEEWWDSLLLG